MTDALKQSKPKVKTPAARPPVVDDALVEVDVIVTREDVTVEQAEIEIAAYVRDHDGVDSVDLFEALRIPIHIVEEAAERLVAQGKLRHTP